MYEREFKIVVIGGNDAGLSAAGRAKRKHPRAKVSVVEQTLYTSYASCGLRYLVSGQVEANLLSGPDADTLSRERGFEVFTGHRVVDINLIKRTLSVEIVAEKKHIEMRYHKLILATGAAPVVPDLFKVDAKNCFTLRNFSDALRISQFCTQQAARHALIVGGGYVGLEVAESLQQRGLSVSLVEKQDSFYSALHPDISSRIMQKISATGLHTCPGNGVADLELAAGAIKSVLLTTGKRIEQIDLVVLATGIRPDADLAKVANIPVGSSGAIQVNRSQQTRRMNVYAAGDCCESIHLVSGKPVWAPFAAIASKQGRVAGDNAAGGRERFPGVLQTRLLRVFDLEFGSTGLDEESAHRAGLETDSTVIQHNDRALYIDGKQTVTIVLIVARGSKRVVGAQVLGAAGSGQRLNILATAIAGRYTVDELAFLDLGYIPEISPVWDPILVAAQVAKKK
ncbi:SidA/IucD/PvdA family monooxygenase [candidate division KSB1 bacterium]|nr:SidA/IucD/PvdA family monooxygenase [candidate division KSB1 bacterium]